jgi:hypothetical protein
MRLAKRLELNTYECWQRLPTQDLIAHTAPFLEAMACFRVLKGNQKLLTCSKFSKLSKVHKHCTFQQTQYELLFKKLALHYCGNSNA